MCTFEKRMRVYECQINYCPDNDDVANEQRDTITRITHTPATEFPIRKFKYSVNEFRFLFDSMNISHQFETRNVYVLKE